MRTAYACCEKSLIRTGVKTKSPQLFYSLKNQQKNRRCTSKERKMESFIEFMEFEKQNRDLRTNGLIKNVCMENFNYYRCHEHIFFWIRV